MREIIVGDYVELVECSRGMETLLTEFGVDPRVIDDLMNDKSLEVLEADYSTVLLDEDCGWVMRDWARIVKQDLAIDVVKRESEVY